MNKNEELLKEEEIEAIRVNNEHCKINDDNYAYFLYFDNGEVHHVFHRMGDDKEHQERRSSESNFICFGSPIDTLDMEKLSNKCDLHKLTMSEFYKKIKLYLSKENYFGGSTTRFSSNEYLLDLSNGNIVFYDDNNALGILKNNAISFNSEYSMNELGSQFLLRPAHEVSVELFYSAINKS